MELLLHVREGGGTRVVRPGQATIRIGRDADNELVIPVAAVSKRHALLRWQGGGGTLEDLGSRNGTRVNGAPVVGVVAVVPGDEIEIGPALVQVAPATDAAERAGFRKRVHDELLVRLDLRRLDPDAIGAAELRRRTDRILGEILEAWRDEVPEGAAAGLRREVLDEALGLGPLEPLLADETVSEILVNRADQIYVERAGRLELAPQRFSSDRAVLAVIERIVSPIGRRIDESSPLVDARLPDGSRVHAIVPPLALKGPCLTIRKFRREPLRVEELVASGAMSPQLAAFLELAVRARRNVVIAGGTGSGKTTLLNVLTGFVPERERIITVEDAAELQVRQPHWVQLEARPANLEGQGAIGIRELVRNCLRMRPDRIVVGECRGGEALDMLQAMNTGHDGSLTTLHANGPREALARLETLCLLSGVELPVRAIRDQIARAVHLVVQQARFPDGSRRITHVCELTGMEGEVIALQELFRWDRQGGGRHVATGFVPRFVEELRQQGEVIDPAIFAREG
ncbi:ATPase, T2SS/T4P/T4SS family [Vulgatibacter sp.]|uniref:ATPase, T2SS/T4P/T4SS family n=1 Tax=Vulgatibacter sp. TaxID=1971226 RepID=UPI003569B376